MLLIPPPAIRTNPMNGHRIPVRRIDWTIGRKFHTTSRYLIEGVSYGVKSWKYLSSDANWCTLLPTLAVGDSMQLPTRRKNLP
jgi:hypothetical protein